MRKFVGILLCAISAVLLDGCAQPRPIGGSQWAITSELKMMPPDVALKLVRTFIPTATKDGFLANKMGQCSNLQPAVVRYELIEISTYFNNYSVLRISSNGPCITGRDINGLRGDEALELSAALIALGAKIKTLAVI